MQDRALVVLATDARINERLIARGMAPMEGPSLGAILREATGESLAPKEALRLLGRRAAGAGSANRRGAAAARRGRLIAGSAAPRRGARR